MQLLFCDTFSKEGLNVGVSGTWAVIDFPRPVILKEIQVVPRGVCVHDQLCIEGQIGNTTPGQFRVDFFASDLNKNLMSTFANLCMLDFNESNQTCVVPHLTFPTDKLLCTGWYTSLTIAVFGVEASDSIAIQGICKHKEHETWNTRSALPLGGDYQHSDRNHKINHLHGNQNYNQPSSHFNFNQKINTEHMNEQHNFNRMTSEERIFHGGSNHDNYQYYNNDLNKPGLLPTPENRTEHVFSGELEEVLRSNQQFIQNVPKGIDSWKPHQTQELLTDKLPGNTKKLAKFEERYRLNNENGDQHTEVEIEEEWVGDDEDYDEISEEEENMEAIEEENLLSTMMNFNPFEMELYALSFYSLPQYSTFEILSHKLQSEEVGTEVNFEDFSKANKAADELKTLIESMLIICPVKINSEDENMTASIIANGEQLIWVSKLERVVLLLDAGFSYLLHNAKNEKIDYATILISWTITALQPDNVFVKLIGTNVRAMKIGIKLVQKLGETTSEIAVALYHVGLIDCLFDILKNKHVASSLKVAAILSIDAIISWPSVMSLFMFGHVDREEMDQKATKPTRYSYLILLALENHAARVVIAIRKLAHKCHFFECTHRVKALTREIVEEKVPGEYLYVEEDESIVEEEEFNEEELSESLEVGNEDEQIHMDTEDKEEQKNEPENIGLRIVNEQGKRKVIGVSRNSHQIESSMSANQGTVQNDSFKSNDQEAPCNGLLSLNTLFGNTNLKVSDEELNELAQCVEEISATLCDPCKFIQQSPIHVFPLSNQSNTKPTNEAELSILLRYIDGCDVLVSIQAILTLPVVSGHYKLFKACSDFIEAMISTQKGLLYLVYNSEIVLNLVQHLMRASPSLDIEKPGTPGYLGTKLAMYAQTMWAVDHIASMLQSPVDYDAVDEELVHTLKILFSLTYPSFGKNFVSKVLVMDDHISGIIRCLWFPDKFSNWNQIAEEELAASEDQEKDSTNTDESKENEELVSEKTEKGPHKKYYRTAVNHYASSLLLMLLHKSDDVSFIYKYKKELQLACLSARHVIPKSDEIKLWVKPLEINELNGSVTDIRKLVDLIKIESANLEPSAFVHIGPVICTSLRLLCYHCSGDPQTIRSRVAEMFAVGGFSVLLNLLSDLNECLQYACKGIYAVICALPIKVHNLVVSLMKTCCHLLHLVLSFLLDASVGSIIANTEKITKILVAIYSDCYMMLKHTNADLLDEITDQVVSVLSLFITCPSNNSDRMNSVMSQLLKFSESRCDNFLCAATLLSQLLPLPLPIIIPDIPFDNAREIALITCSLWSAIIMPHLDHICSLLVPLSSSTSAPLIELVVIVAQQIIDLAPELATMVITKYIDDIAPVLVSTFTTGDIDTHADNISIEKELMLSPEQMTAITTFSHIVSLPTGKATLLKMVHDNVYGIMDIWLYATNLETPTEAAASILLLASLVVDQTISMLPATNMTHNSNLPPNDHIKAITVLSFVQLFHSSLLVCSRAFGVLHILVSQSSTFTFVLQELEKNTDGLYAGVENLNKIYDVSDKNCAFALYNLTQLLDSLTISTETRIRPLTNSQLKWILCKDGNDTPLRGLESKVKESFISGKFDQSVMDILDTVIDRLSSYNQGFDVVKSEAVSVCECEVPEFTNIQITEQFKNREVFHLGTDDTCLQTRLLITGSSLFNKRIFTGINPKDERVVQCDLIATADKFCPGFNLEEEILRVAKSSGLQHNDEESEAAMLRRRQKLESYTARMGKTITFMKRSHGLLVTQHSTGRSRGRGNPINRPFDLFRHRKQNTSRPPSMHVDDFLAADEEQLKNERDCSFKSPPPPHATSQRRPALRTFKREFTSRGRGRGRGGFRFSRGGYNSSTTNDNLGKFRTKMSPASVRGGSMDRFRGNDTSITSRLSFVPREGFKTKKSESFAWSGHARAFSQGGVSTRGREWKLPTKNISNRGSYSHRGKSWTGIRRGQGYGKPRGKHIRSFTR